MKLEIRTPSGPTEDSVAIRVVVAAAVELAIVAVVAQGAVHAPTAVATLILAPLGYWFSYRRRAHTSLLLKLLLSLGLLAAMGQFLQAVQQVGSVDEARIPLASLFLWVQVLHAFDVPRRRDLAFSMVSGLILMAEAGALSLTTGYALYLVPWLVLAGMWLYLSSRPRPDQVATPVAHRLIIPGGGPRRGRLAPARAAFMPASAALLAGALVFLALPRVPGSLVKTPPFAFPHSPTELPNFDGGVTNPNLPAAGADGVVNFAPGAYPGLSDVVDLRARGRLSDRIAFRVRASQAALWRAEAFDTYDGTTWTIASKDTQTLPTADAPGAYMAQPTRGPDGLANLPSVPVTQTFYIDAPQPNILFAAANASRVYFPSGGLREDRYGSIRAPILLDQGLVYSVVSDVPVNDPSWLRRAGHAIPPSMAGYLQLPATLPARVGDLARQVAQGAPSEYDAVMAVQTWIQGHTRYNLDVPADPPGVDSVDRFLFVTREGFCEQIASSMAVMLRTLGIPTRLVTGYGPGDRNPLTGYFEVRDSDAHAWLEVYYPQIGWVPYDPTFGVPAAAPSVASRFMAGPVFAAIGRFVQRAVPQPVKHVVGVALGAVATTARAALHVWPVAVLALLALGAIAALWRRRRTRPPTPADPAEAAFVELTRALAPAGHAREEHETPSEYLGALARDDSIDGEVVAAAEEIVRTFERARFGPEARKPSPEEVAGARAMLERVRERAGAR